MKIQYVFTVTREYNPKTQAEIDTITKSFESIEGEPGEYLYGGSGMREKVEVKMITQGELDGEWHTNYGTKLCPLCKGDGFC